MRCSARWLHFIEHSSAACSLPAQTILINHDAPGVLVPQIEVDKPLGLKFTESKAPGGGLKVTVSKVVLAAVACKLTCCWACACAFIAAAFWVQTCHEGVHRYVCLQPARPPC